MEIAADKTGVVSAWRGVSTPAIAYSGLLLVILIEYLGLAAEFGVLRALRISTLFAYGTFLVVIAYGGFAPAATSRQGRWLLGLFGMAAISILYAVVRAYVPAVLRSHVDYFALFVTAAAVVDRQSRVKGLAVTTTGVVLALVLRNLDLLTSGVRVGAFRANVFMGDGNDFAWGLIALMPMPLYLMLGRHGVLSRLFGLAGVSAAAFAVAGTQSRGATLGITAAALYYLFFMSRRRLAGLVVVVALALVTLAFAPAGYLTRVTDTEVSDDASAQGRIRAWTAATKMAIDYPLGVGAGSFNSAYGRFYIGDPDETFSSRRWISAHSIYFKVLGESGFVGLFLLLGLLTSNFRDNAASMRASRLRPDRCRIDGLWPASLNFGLVGYVVAGAFLGGLTYPHIYLLSGLTVACRRMTADGGSDSPTPALAARHISSPRLLSPRVKSRGATHYLPRPRVVG
ncbi:O-antigen ligase family protein [Luteitalea sp.]|uniref:O-antigen ligase family protein n=1 Tax=Luteitalea sp. TaxID=2004800 RepID=UPI0025C18BCC|nr:O-antigen ligase family protein [Luteitalea sp.]